MLPEDTFDVEVLREAMPPKDTWNLCYMIVRMHSTRGRES